MGQQFFSKVQYGKESAAAHGTKVAATRILPGKVPAIKSDRKPTYPAEQFGVRASARRAVIHQMLYTNTLSVPNASFQALLPFFGCGLKGGITPTETTTGQSDFPWDFTPSLTGANSPDSLTLELGDDTQAFVAEYAMFERIKLAWQVAQDMSASPIALDADFFSRQLAKQAFTGALSLPTQTDMNGKLSRLFVDTAWAGIGGTELANSLRAADCEILTGVHPKFEGSANKYFNAHAEGIFEIMMSLTLEGNAAAQALMDAQQAGTFNAVRLQVDGPQIGTGTSHQLQIDAGGVWEDVSPLASQDRSDNLFTATFHGFYDTTGAKELQVKVITDRATY